jgi:hypothetical protein
MDGNFPPKHITHLHAKKTKRMSAYRFGSMDATSSLTCGPPIVRFVIKNLKILDMDLPSYIVCVLLKLSFFNS